jgi:endonuclease YncB( thermonuclease family)
MLVPVVQAPERVETWHAETRSCKMLQVLWDAGAARPSSQCPVARHPAFGVPGAGQPFGYRAKQFTSSLVFGRNVTVIVQGSDRHQRTIAHITTDQGLDLSTELIRAGFAWWYRQYSRNAQLGALEMEARTARRGLWEDASPTPPWEWRRKR